MEIMITNHPAAPAASAPIPQPFLHELITCVRAPAVALSGRDGQIRAGAAGLFCHDRRVLSELTVDVDGQPPVPVGHQQPSATAARFVGVVRHLGDPIADPTVRVERHRDVTGDGLTEEIVLVNNSRQPVSATLGCRLAVDFAGVDAVKAGRAPEPRLPEQPAPATLTWRDPYATVTVDTTGAPTVELAPDHTARLTWQVQLPARSRFAVTLTLTATRTQRGRTNTFDAPTRPVWPQPATVTGPPDLAQLFRRGVADLEALTLAAPDRPDAVFAAAGSPWYLTLFGRDSLWAARLTLPLGTDLAAGTLRALADRQGTRHDPETAEAPGKIPHEVRPEGIGDLPSVYFGTVDATALWVCLLHDAWRWGMPDQQVRALLDPLRAALTWLTTDADADADGFLEYLDHTGRGLANQGWKDSGDAIQFPDGTIAAPPIALAEAQAYAYQAALAGATLLEAYGQDGADRIRQWAATLQQRFRSAFWVDDVRGRFPAIALDGDKRPVGVAASNLGHLLGTGLLRPDEAATVAARLAAPDLDCGYGLRTLSAEVAGFNPLGYHTGSVWPHDTAIAVTGLVREGHPAAAASLAAGLLRAAPRFDHRLPELFGGVTADDAAGDAPLAYPASCRPQAWSAAVAVALVGAALGLEADVPDGHLTVRIRPEFADWFPLRVEGLRVAGHPLTVEVDADGTAVVETTAPLEVQVEPATTGPRVPRTRSADAPRPAATEEPGGSVADAANRAGR